MDLRPSYMCIGLLGFAFAAILVVQKRISWLDSCCYSVVQKRAEKERQKAQEAAEASGQAGEEAGGDSALTNRANRARAGGAEPVTRIEDRCSRRCLWAAVVASLASGMVMVLSLGSRCACVVHALCGRELCKRVGVGWGVRGVGLISRNVTRPICVYMQGQGSGKCEYKRRQARASPVRYPLSAGV